MLVTKIRLETYKLYGFVTDKPIIEVPYEVLVDAYYQYQAPNYQWALLFARQDNSTLMKELKGNGEKPPDGLKLIEGVLYQW